MLKHSIIQNNFLVICDLPTVLYSDISWTKEAYLPKGKYDNKNDSYGYEKSHEPTANEHNTHWTPTNMASLLYVV